MQKDAKSFPVSYVRDESGRFLRELHGITLAQMVEYLVAKLGYPTLAERVRIRCFSDNPSVSSSLTFLRRTPWARAEVEAFYIQVRGIELTEARALMVASSSEPSESVAPSAIAESVPAESVPADSE